MSTFSKAIRIHETRWSQAKIGVTFSMVPGTDLTQASREGRDDDTHSHPEKLWWGGLWSDGEAAEVLAQYVCYLHLNTREGGAIDHSPTRRQGLWYTAGSRRHVSVIVVRAMPSGCQYLGGESYGGDFLHTQSTSAHRLCHPSEPHWVREGLCYFPWGWNTGVLDMVMHVSRTHSSRTSLFRDSFIAHRHVCS